ncbi:protein roadkill-like [Stomoxys calcitrans]|uniref:protein roadkill-like n=1 Tax=Stomoxys calcitrans TaxID=35570 RepID=UPI0027E2E720|nr:protein roadkill-like [Stomoxys calcitrans]
MLRDTYWEHIICDSAVTSGTTIILQHVWEFPMYATKNMSSRTFSSQQNDVRSAWHLDVDIDRNVFLNCTALSDSPAGVMYIFSYSASILEKNTQRGHEFGEKSTKRCLERNKWFIGILPDYDTYNCGGFCYLYILIKISTVNISLSKTPIESNAVVYVAATTTKGPQGDLSKDLSVALKTGKDSDITLVAKGIEIKAHKFILSLRSDVFAAMFEHKSMKENSTNCVDIEDFEANVIREMLSFMYTGKLGPKLDWTLAKNLYAAADKYNVKQLKAECEKFLMSDLGIQTAVRTLIKAEVDKNAEKKLQALQFVKDNIEWVVRTHAWRELSFRYSHLIVELMNIK